MLLDGSNINFVIAFLAGVVSFLAPCFLSVVILQITIANRYRSFLFIFGFLLVFIGLGVAAGSLRFLAELASYMSRAGGILLIFVGLYNLGLLRLPILGGGRNLTPFLIGVTFGFSWVPCVGPVLALVLFWISSQETLSKGLLLLFFYSLGFVLPFLVLSVLFNWFSGYTSKLKMVGYYLMKLAAILTILVGVLLVTGRFGYLIALSLRLENALF